MNFSFSRSENKRILEAYLYQIEEGEEGSTIKLYRGIDGESGFSETDGTNPEYGDNLFTTDEPGYAKVYARLGKKPTIIEYSVDQNDLSIATIGNLDDILGFEVDGQQLYDGLNDEETEKVLTNGYNCVYFETEDQSHEIYYLLDRGIIRTRRVLSDEEYDKIEVEESVQ